MVMHEIIQIQLNKARALQWGIPCEGLNFQFEESIWLRKSLF